MRSSKTRTSHLRPRWRHEHDEPRASAHWGPDFPTPCPPRCQLERGAAPWTSPAALDSALTEIDPGRVQLISQPRQQGNNRIILPTPRQVTVHAGDVSILCVRVGKGVLRDRSNNCLFSLHFFPEQESHHSETSNPRSRQASDMRARLRPAGYASAGEGG